MVTINPSTGKILQNYDEYSAERGFGILNDAHEAFQKWRKRSFSERGGLMKNAAVILRKNADQYASLMTSEMGKPIAQAKAEVSKCAWCLEFYADNAEKFLEDEMVQTDASKSYVRFEPLGVILAVMPWNFPFWQVFRFVAPTLMAGNTAVLKHASNVSGCALAIEKIFEEAGFPKNVFRTLLVSSKNIESLIGNPNIAAVTVTGSSEAGKSVASLSGKYLKKCVLELGGSDPFIVLDDVDVDTCAVQAVGARMINSGQSCIAAKRFIVLEKIADQFEKAFVKKTESSIIGDPMDPKTEIGPMAREDLLLNLDKQVQDSIKQGAKLLTGGKRFNHEGYYYLPTVLSHVKKGRRSLRNMPAYDEEMFGPVAAILRVKDEEEAIRVANDTPFGLGASVWTKDQNRGEVLAKQIQAGAVFVNGIVKSDPRLPFGGVKKSGYGRELGSYGIKEFVNVKTVWMR